jgi:hypothetical protein
MNIEQIKEKYTCLEYLGDRVVKKVANGYLARAPWREDKHPSLTVTLNGEGWHDMKTGEHGSIIDLVSKDRGMTKKQVCAWFDAFAPISSSFHPQEFYGGKEKDGFASFSVMPLQSRGLYAYLHERRINIDIARQFLQEAHYSFEERTDGRYLYALAYANDLGGYELRSERFKGGTSPKGISTHFGQKNASVVVFEGFMDMLSFATLCGEVRHNYVTLNSIVNAPAAIEVLRNYQGAIYLCLDNDDGGEDATKEMLDALPSAIDIRSRFTPAKDVNEYLCKLRAGK